jgi:DNA-binding transcriptional regulator LsrR (DeoR family)
MPPIKASKPLQPIAQRYLKNLNALRDDRGLTNKQIAQALSEVIGGQVHEVNVRRWFSETDPTIPNLEHLYGLCRIFGVTPNELIGDSDDVARMTPLPIEYRGRPLIKLVRQPRPGEENGVDIARRLCREETPEQVAKDWRIDEGEFESQLRRAAYGDLFEVIEPVPTNDVCARRLKEKYNLKLVEVADIDSIGYGLLQTVILGALGAKMVRESQQSAPQAVGLAGGFSCARLVMSLIQGLPRSDGLKLMPIAVQGSLGVYTSLNANTLVGMFGYFMGRSSPDDVTILQYISNADLAGKPDHPTQQQLNDIVRQVSIAFLGLGGNVRWFFNGIFRSPSPVPGAGDRAVTGADLSAAGCMGDILYNFVNAPGVMGDMKPVCDRLVCSIGLKGLRELVAVRKIPVVAIVADENKVPVARLAMREGYINGLITTKAVADKLLT